MNQHDTPAKGASLQAFGLLVAAALTAADEYAEAAGHAECWTGTHASYNQHVAEARAKVSEAIAAAVAAERERCAKLCTTTPWPAWGDTTEDLRAALADAMRGA